MKEKQPPYANKRVTHRLYIHTLLRKQKSQMTNTTNLLETNFPSQNIPKKEAGGRGKEEGGEETAPISSIAYYLKH